MAARALALSLSSGREIELALRFNLLAAFRLGHTPVRADAKEVLLSRWIMRACLGVCAPTRRLNGRRRRWLAASPRECVAFRGARSLTRSLPFSRSIHLLRKSTQKRDSPSGFYWPFLLPIVLVVRDESRRLPEWRDLWETLGVACRCERAAASVPCLSLQRAFELAARLPNATSGRRPGRVARATPRALTPFRIRSIKTRPRARRDSLTQLALKAAWSACERTNE